MTLSLNMTAIRERSAYQLAEKVGCEAPASLESTGAIFLRSVRDQTLEAVNEALENDNEPEWVTDNDPLSEIEGNAPATGVVEMWAQFVDLGAWRDDFQEMNQQTIIGLVDTYKYKEGLPKSDAVPTMEDQARVALYEIARTLIFLTVQELQSQYEEIEAREDEDEE